MELPPPELSLEEELKACLAKKSNAYIFKDLPRLALRTTVWAKSAKPEAKELRSSGPRLFIDDEESPDSDGGGGLDLPPGTDLERSQEFSQEIETETEKDTGVISLRLSDMLEVEALTRSRGESCTAAVLSLEGSVDEDEETVDELLDVILDSWHSPMAQERVEQARNVFQDSMIFSESDLALLSDNDWADLKQQGIPLGLKNKLCKLVDLRRAARASSGEVVAKKEAPEQAREEKTVQESETTDQDATSADRELGAPRRGRDRSRSNPLCVSHETITMLDGTQMRMAKKKSSGQRTAMLKKGRAPKLRQGALVNVTSLMPAEEKAGFVQLCEIERVVTSIAKVLEVPPLYYKILAEFHDLKQENHFELEMLLDHVFTDTIGLESRTTFLLKAIQQGLIMAASYHLKYHVTKELMTRDVQGREGWQIVINISDSVVNVTHMRREQALASAGVDNYFWFEWHLTMTLDRKNCTHLHSSSLRIVDLWLSKSMHPDMKETLNRRFCAGKLRIC